MINVIVPIVENVDGFLNFIQKESKPDVKFFVGVLEKFKDKLGKLKNAEVHVYYNNSNCEEIINSLHSCKMERGKIMIARRPLTSEEFEKLISSKEDITTLKAHHNKIGQFFRNLISKILRRIFAFVFFDDISAICYSENMFELLSVCSNLSMASRLNKYVGVTFNEIETHNKQVKKKYNKWLNILKFAIYTLILGGSIAGGICICIFANTRVLTIVAIICWYMLALMLWLAGLLNFTRTIAVGELRYGRAEEVFN